MTEFRFPMSVRERIMGIVYIIFHTVLIPLAVSFAYMMIFKPMGVETNETVLNTIVYAIGLVFCITAMFRFLKMSFSDIFEKPITFIVCVIVGFFVSIFMNIALSIALINMGVEELTNPNSAAIDMLAGENRGMMLATAVLFAPIIEECMFRGALFGTIRTKSRIAAYIVTVFAFSMYHLWSYFLTSYSPSLWLYMLQYVPYTLVLCRVYEKSGTIWCPIILHAAINAFAMSAN